MYAIIISRAGMRCCRRTQYFFTTLHGPSKRFFSVKGTAYKLFPHSNSPLPFLGVTEYWLTYIVVDVGGVVADGTRHRHGLTAAVGHCVVDVRVPLQPPTVAPVLERPETTALELKEHRDHIRKPGKTRVHIRPGKARTRV